MRQSEREIRDVSVKDQLVEEMKQAMKSRDEIELSTIRLVRAAVRNAEIEKGEDLDDESVVEVIQREAKRRREAIEAYDKADRTDLADRERAELEILRRYLPEQLGEIEIAEIVRGIIAEVGAVGPKDKGKVMGLLMQRHRGRVDGKTANQVADMILQG